MGSYAIQNFVNKILSKSKDKQLMEYDGKLVKERIRGLLESESKFKAAIDKILPEKYAAILFGNIILELIKEDDRNDRNIPASFLSGLMYMRPKLGLMVKHHKRLLEILNGLEEEKEIHNGLSSAPCLQGASSLTVTHNHTMNDFKVEFEMSDSINGGPSNPGNGGANDTSETDSSSGGSSRMADLEGGNDPDDGPLIAPRINGDEGNNGNPDMIYWTGIHRVFLKISFVVGGAKLYFYDTESGQSSTDYVILAMGGVAFLSSILGLIAAHKYRNFSKGLAVVGGPSAMFAVIACMIEVIYPEYAILVGGAGSLVSLLLLLDTALGFKESEPPFLACIKRALGFQCISPEGQIRLPV